MPRRPLVQPVNRHDRKELLDRPAVGNRLEQREVAEVGVRQRLVEALEILRHVVHRLHQLLKLQADRPVEVLGQRSLLERQIAAREQVHRHVERLLGVVVALERVPRRQAVVGLDQIDQRLFHLRRRGLRHGLVAEAGDAEHVEHQHAVMRDDRAAAFRDDRRVRHLRLVAHGLQVIDDVVGVLLQRVVHARLEVGLRAVVVDAEAAADVQVLQPGARLDQLDVDARRFVQRALHDADVRDLAAEVKVEQLEAVLHAARLQFLEPAQNLADGQAELRAIAARRLPAAAAAGGELDPHADRRPDADLLRVFEDQVQLGVFLDDRDDVPADLLRQHGHLDELGVLEAVADDRRVVVGERHHRQQLRLRARLEAEVVRAAELEHLLDDLALLIDLDRVDADVPSRVLVLRDGALEGFVDVLQPVLQDVAKPDAASAGRCRGAAGRRPAA